MYFLKPISEANAVREGLKPVQLELEGPVLLPGKLFNHLNPIVPDAENLHQQSIEEDEAIFVDHEHLAGPHLSVQDTPHEQVVVKTGFEKISDPVSSSRTTGMVNERLHNYRIESYCPSDSIVRAPQETRGTDKEFDRVISSNPLAEDIFYVNPKQYYRILKQRVARQLCKENEFLLCSENEEGLRKTDYVHGLRRLRPRGESFLTADELGAVERHVGTIETKRSQALSKGLQSYRNMQESPEEPEPSNLPLKIRRVTVDKSKAQRIGDHISANLLSMSSNMSSWKGKRPSTNSWHNHSEAPAAVRRYRAQTHLSKTESCDLLQSRSSSELLVLLVKKNLSTLYHVKSPVCIDLPSLIRR